KVGNACLHTLSLLPGDEAVAQLGRLKSKVKHASARAMTDKALKAAAVRTGLSPEDLEETAIPTYGLDAPGCLTRAFGPITAEVAIAGTRDVEIYWLRENGKRQKSVPAEVKQGFHAEVKELQRTVRDIEQMLPAQRDRLERLLLRERDWALADWRTRYLEH